MADEKLVTPAEKAQEQERIAARETERRDPPADETEPGGRFMVGDELVDSEGKPVKK